jgi:ribosomal protein S18 acetylase RimI-like enzyme
VSASTVAEDMRVEELTPVWCEALTALFAALGDGRNRFFHPHLFTPAEASRVCAHQGRDGYFALLSADRALGYGYLRGWDEGFDEPSLGIAIHPDHQGRGLARLFMEQLHREARRRGACSIRLRVHPSNDHAHRLYERLGYVFSGMDQGEAAGRFILSPPPPPLKQ